MKIKLCSLAILTVQVAAAAVARGEDRFVAHEWGTFTSVQGADGLQLEWNPFVSAELPGFVYKSKTVPGLSSPDTKSAFRTLQRMETPVIYFYGDRETRADVTVEFPQGIVTEWFPQGKQSMPAIGSKPGRTNSGIIRWENVQVLPMREHLGSALPLPLDTSGSHYYAARVADADYVRLEGADKKSETEKFLFYRGVGSFVAPLTVTQLPDGESFVVLNTGREPLGNLFLYTVRGDRAAHVALATLAPGASATMKLPAAQVSAPLSEARSTIAARVRDGLVREGLYEAEATAMVRTWDDSWFAEQGTRVLYTLPRAWTDRTLPLTVAPQPTATVRVMVGRAEAITPAMEWEVLKQVVRYSDPDTASRARVIEATRQLGYGRFMEPAARRLAARVPGREFQALSSELLAAALKPAAKSLAAK